jgi:histidine triad (HIT) family protein
MSDCLFCKIVSGDIPSEKLYEDDDLIAFRDIHAQAPLHLLVIPRKHIASLDDAGADDGELLGKILLVARQLAAENGAAGGYRVVTNCGAAAGQSVFHIHFHLLGGRSLGWPPG